MTRKTKNPVDMSTLFKSTSGTLAQLSQKTNSIKKIDSIVRQICPDLPEESWHIANFSQNRIVIEVGSPIWGQRLQFEKNRIANQLRIDTQGVFTQVELKVNPYFNRAKPNPELLNKPKKSMSVDAAKHIEHVAANAPKSLQEKLLKLAQHVNKNED